MKLIFFDTEFTALSHDAKLISLGCVSDCGREFYAELDDGYRTSECTLFVKSSVLPLLQVDSPKTKWKHLPSLFGKWISVFYEPVQMVTDNTEHDWPWIKTIFHGGRHPSNLIMTPLRLSINEVKDIDLFNAAVVQAFKDGLRRHHALDDAKANRLGFLACGGFYEW